MTLAACAEIVRRGDPDRFLAAMAAPPAARQVLFPLYAFNLEVSRAPWVTEEPMIAEMRLQFWRDVMEEIGAGKPPRAHEVVAPLHGAIRAGDAPLLDAMIAARRWDIYKDAFEDQAHFDSYIDASSGHLIWVAARALGAPDAAEPALRAHGFASGLAGFLRAVPELEARGRVPLLDGTPQGVRDLANRGLEKLAEARAGRASVPADAGVALYAGWRAEAALKAARDVPERVIEGKLDESEFARRVRLIRLSLTGRW
ncbi:phytoene synthase [Rhodophyticola sp. CCM32]|uniref:squalene/phytoene synthase family protein n=1 Tax=Rhodophyticola sp. CCM32 TaxID=2916397 RepID=UPI00107F348B|nr:squalene/phytoene synthase family protein [Rhodophyticola sp. CCM32]QBY00631.1 phytoene synthase [Rhodophyticola sp. CCM32]